VHAVEPVCGASLPNGQGAQTVLELVPTRLEAVLTGHNTHEDIPVAPAKLPAAQRTHCAAAADVAEALPIEPALHTAPRHEPAPGAAAQVPERQAMQATAAGSGEDEPSGPALPAMQGMPTHAEAPASAEYVPEAHAKHAAPALDAAPAAPKKPAAHAAPEQAEEPASEV
jgi:hypothetical protein